MISDKPIIGIIVMSTRQHMLITRKDDENKKIKKERKNEDENC